LKKTLTALASAAVLVGALAGCGSAPSDDKSASNESLKIATFGGIFIELPLYYAQDQGIFKKEGLDVSLLAVDGNQIPVVAGGSVDLFENATANVLRANAEGQSFKAVFPAGNKNIFSLVAGPKWKVSHEGAGYPDAVADLKGARVGVPARGGEAEIYVGELLKAAGYTASDVTFVATGAGPSQLAAIKAGQADIAVTNEPGTSSAINAGAKMLLDLRDGSAGLPELFTKRSVVWATVDKTLTSKSKAVQAFGRAMSASVNEILDPAHKDEAIAQLSKMTGLDKAAAGALFAKNSDYFTGKFSCSAYDESVQLLDVSGSLPKSKTGPCKEFIWSSAIKYISADEG
jgi:NitT/TauT family transport system substrate-binding protein